MGKGDYKTGKINKIKKIKNEESVERCPKKNETQFKKSYTRRELIGKELFLFWIIYVDVYLCNVFVNHGREKEEEK